MACQQTAINQVQHLESVGALDCDRNVMIIRIMGIREVTSRIPKEIRKALNDAVKSGQLGRLPKKDAMPEVYYHPNSKVNAIGLRQQRQREAVEALKGVYAFRTPL